MRPRPVLYRIYFSFAGGMSHTCVSVRPRPISHTVFYVHMYTERRGCISMTCLCFCESVRPRPISHTVFYVHMYTERRGCISGACLCFCETQAHILYSILCPHTLRDEVVYL